MARDVGNAGPRRLAVWLSGALALALTLTAPLLLGAQDPQDPSGRSTSVPRRTDDGSSGCLGCHGGIEPMHPEAELSCVDCHGGDATTKLKLQAHVPQPTKRIGDERVRSLTRNLAWRRFKNPMDLRVVSQTCATCHQEDVDHLFASLHGTTAGHLSDGYYEMGLTKKRGSKYAIFQIANAPDKGGAVSRLNQVPPFMSHRPADELATHYSDLARKECMQCHLYSEGRSVRGRVGFDGDYRGEGCAACHVAYDLDGLSGSADSTVPKGEPGHARAHAMTRAPTTQSCTSCHYGDASIGLHFRGLSQLPPGAPGGPDIPGTTDKQLNRTFYLNDPGIVPPDVHHERGMHCIDCHTKGDVMGDGKLHGQMEYAVETSCESCHGTFTERSTLKTERGTPLEHLRWDGANVLLTSKVDGEEHLVPQVVHVLDRERPEYNEAAAEAMTSDHANIECYTCHASWNVNFLGFHFSRIESLTQLDLLSGKRTPGRVTTQEKVFATWKSFYAGFNESGRVAPYMTGFSTMGSVWDEEGELILDQVMPETAEGLSGMSMVHHQLHTTRPTARSCVECHRTSSTWGMGSANFRLARQLAFVADRRGIEVVALNRAELTRSAPLAKLVLPDIVELVADTDPLQGHARYLYAAEGGRGLHVIDVADPTKPRRVAFVASVNPRGMKLSADHLYLADGIGGLKIYDISEPERIHLVGKVPTFDAHDVDVQWPWAYVADGPGGLAIVDVRAPIAPRFLTAIDANGVSRLPNETIQVSSLFQFSRPRALADIAIDRRTKARNLCAVLDRTRGFELIDVTEPELPEILFPPEDSQSRGGVRNVSYRGLALLSQVDFAEAQGGERTAERDYAYLLVESGGGNQRSRIALVDVSDPLSVRGLPRGGAQAGFSTEQLVVADFYNPPFKQRVLFTPGELGVYMADVTTSRQPVQIGALPAIQNAYSIALEEFPLDRMIDESGRRLKDISHPGSRWAYLTEVERILSVPAEALNTDVEYDGPAEVHGLTARLHLERLDENDSGFLEGGEYAEAGGAGVDGNGDGRISLRELARKAGMLGPPPQAGGQVVVAALSGRVGIDGDIARLVDGVDPYRFDGNNDNQLDRRETARAVFAALDLNDDERLVPDELSRYPGELRQLRYGDARARELFRELDTSPDGRVNRREFKLREAEWEAFDANRDGFVSLLPGYFDFQRERGFVRAGAEWPTRRGTMLPLPPGLSSETFFATFDADGDEMITRKELRPRPELFMILDRNGDEYVDSTEVNRLLAGFQGGGVDAAVDDFLGRWDLDKSGRIEPNELPAGVRLRLAKHLKGD